VSQPTKSSIAILAGSKEVHGHEATIETLTRLMESIPRGIATAVVCYIGSRWEGDDAAAWMDLDRTKFQPFLLRPETREAIAHYAASESVPIVVFTRRRALTLLRLAHVLCPDVEGHEVTAQETEDGRFAMGEAFLLVGGLQESKSELELEDTVALILGAFEESNRPTLMLAYTRAYTMVRDSAWSSEPILVEAAARFSRTFELSIREFMYVIVAFVTKLLSQQGEELHGIFKLTDVFAKAMDREGIRRVVEAVSIPIPEIEGAVGKDLAGIIKSRSQEPFRSRPLIASSREDVFLCPDLYGMGEQLSSGLFWKILGLFSTPGERNQFSAAWAKLFEKPVADRLEKALLKGRSGLGPHPRLYRSPLDDQGGELTDIMIVCGPDAVLIECKAFILTEKAKYSGNSADLVEEARRKLLKEDRNGVQLVRALRRLFGNRELQAKYFGTHTIRKVYPAIVCMDHAITIPTIGPMLDAVFRSDLKDIVPKGVEVKPLSILNADDADSMAAVVAAGKRPHALFRGRFEVDREGGNTFHNHLFDVMTKMGVEKPGEEEEFSALFDDAKAFWTAQGDPPVFPQ